MPQRAWQHRTPSSRPDWPQTPLIAEEPWNSFILTIFCHSESTHSVGSLSSRNSPTSTAAYHLETTLMNAIARDPRRPLSNLTSGILRNNKNKDVPRCWSSAFLQFLFVGKPWVMSSTDFMGSSCSGQFAFFFIIFHLKVISTFRPFPATGPSPLRR